MVSLAHQHVMVAPALAATGCNSRVAAGVRIPRSLQRLPILAKMFPVVNSLSVSFTRAASRANRARLIAQFVVSMRTPPPLPLLCFRRCMHACSVSVAGYSPGTFRLSLSLSATLRMALNLLPLAQHSLHDVLSLMISRSLLYIQPPPLSASRSQWELPACSRP